MARQGGFQTVQVFGQTAKQRQLFADRHVFGQRLLQARQQPVDGGSAGTRLARVQLVPMVLAKVVQQVQTGLQAGEGFALEKAPGQPGGGPQILGLGGQQVLAALAYLLPVDSAGFMQRRGLAQLGFQHFVFAGITHVFTGEVPFINRGFGQIEIMSGELAGVRHSMTRLLKWATSAKSHIAAMA